MGKILGWVAALLFTASSVLADDIAVYRGTWRKAMDADIATQHASTMQAFLVVNYTKGQAGEILYFNQGGKKLTRFSLPFHIVSAQLSNGKTATLIATGEAYEPGIGFSFLNTLLRGTNVSLPIETKPERRSIQRPRIFVGNYSYVGAMPQSSANFEMASISYALDVARTVKANNADQSHIQVLDEIEAALTAKGHVPI